MGRPKGSKNKKNLKQAGIAPTVEQGACASQVEGANPSSGSTSEDRFEKLERSIAMLTQIMSGLVDQKVLDQKAAEGHGKTIQEKLMIPGPGEKMVGVNVRPEVNINGAKFCGQMMVPQSLAHRLNDIVQTRRDMQARENLDIDHGVKELATLKG